MRHLILVCCLLARVSFLTAQEDRQMAGNIAKYINSSSAEALFALFDSSFQKQFPLAEVRNAILSLQSSFGEFGAVTRLKERNGEYLYALAGTKNAINIVFGLNNGFVSRLLFTPDDPFFEVKKRTTWLTDNELATDLDRKVDSIVRAVLLKSNTPGLSIGVIQNGRSFTYNYGERGWGRGRLPTSHSVFEIGSLTKPFTGTVLAHFIRSGQVNLEDPVNKYLPDSIRPITWNNEPLRVKHLVGHSAGMPHENTESFGAPVTDDPDNRMKFYETRHLLAMLNHWQPYEEPGSKFRYSNLGYSILAYICERISGQSIGQLYRQLLFEPLKMKDSYLAGERPMGDIQPTKTDGSPALPTFLLGYAPSGAIRSTVNDLLRFASLQLQPDASGPGADIRMTQQEVLKSELSMGLGWFMNESDKGMVFSHSGGVAGFTSRFIFRPSTKTAVVVLSNCRNLDATEVADGIFQKINP